MERERKSILELWEENPYLEYGSHDKLVALVLCPDPYCEDYMYDYNEIIYTVPVGWLLNWLTLHDNNRSGWREGEMFKWLQEEYTSEESEQIFNDAMKDQKIVTLNFDSVA